MKKILSLIVAVLAVGCHVNAQIPPVSSHTVVLTWTAPPANANWPGCGTTAPQSPCVYAVYACVASASACGNTTNSAWHELTNSTNRPSGLTFTDTTPSVGQNYYAVTTVQQSAISGASNVANVNVPGPPAPPALANPTVASNELPHIVLPPVTKELDARLGSPGILVATLK